MNQATKENDSFYVGVGSCMPTCDSIEPEEIADHVRKELVSFLIANRTDFVEVSTIYHSLVGIFENISC